MSKLEIRPAPVSLLAHIKTAMRETWEDHRARQPHAFAKGDIDTYILPDLALAFKDLDGSPLAESPRIFAAYRDDTYAGHIILSELNWSDGTPRNNINIEDIHVASDLRGQGIGRSLLSHVQSLSKDRDWDNLTATIWQGNDSSEKLFAETGFEPLARTVRFGPERQVRDLPALNQTPTGRGPINLALAFFIALIVLGFALMVGVG